MTDTRLSKGFPLRDFQRLGKYSDASESIYVMRQDITNDGIPITRATQIGPVVDLSERQNVSRSVYYIARDMSFVNRAVMVSLDEPWIEKTTKNLLDSVGNNVEEMQHHDTVTTWWELAVDSDSAAYTLFMLVVAELLRK